MKMKKTFFAGKNLSYVYMRGFNPTYENIIKLIDLISHEYLLGVFTALDTTNEFIRTISKDYINYDVLIPPDNSITSNTIIITSKQNFITKLHLVLTCEPRCLTFYGLYSGYNLNININKHYFINLDSIVSIGNSITDASISVVVDEFYAEISLDSHTYDAKTFLRKIETISFD